MYLEKFELRGFKSFADPVTLTFTPGITAIVGPNGSGKSNVSDAIRWVLGEQSMKLLRGKRSDDVIFSGSDRKSQLGMAEVTMTINNADGKMPVDFPEVVITRRVYRNGEGEYFLNKRPAKLQDMLLLFARAHFGQKSYSVVAQGMIDHVLVATPTERKAFFDEAAGVRQYQIKREQAIRRLDETRSNLSQAEMLMAEIEPRLRSLTRQVRRLERRGEVERSLHDIQESYYAAKFWNIRTEEERLIADRNAKEQELSAAKQRVEAVQSSLEGMEKEQGREERFTTLQQEYTDVLEQKNRYLRESAELKGRLDADAIRAGDLPLVWLQKRQEELRAEQRRYTEQQEGITNKRGKYIRERKSIERDLAAMQKSFESASKELMAFKETVERAETPERFLMDFEKTVGDHAALLKELQSAQTVEGVQKLLPDAAHIQDALAGLAERAASFSRADARKFLTIQERVHEALEQRAELEQRLVMNEKESASLERESAMYEQFLGGIMEELGRIKKELQRSETAPTKGQEDETTADIREIEQKMNELDARLATLRTTISEFNTQEESKREELFKLQKQFRDEQQILNDVSQVLNSVRVELAGVQAHREDLERAFSYELPEEHAAAVRQQKNAPASVDFAAREQEIERLKHQLELIGGIDEGVQEEYTTTNERFTHLSEQVEDLVKAIADLEKAITELDTTIKREFNRAFERINKEFGVYFKALFEGGRAELVLIKEEPRTEEQEDEDPASAGASADEDDKEGEEDDVMPVKKGPVEKIVTGVDIKAVPPGKRVSTINMLSGGERALTSIALLSAIIATNPSPFVFLDEVDAALDEANSQRFAKIIKQLSKHTQFITVTHNRATMEQADILYGVTMSPDSVSRILSVKMEEVDKVIQSQANR